MKIPRKVSWILKKIKWKQNEIRKRYWGIAEVERKEDEVVEGYRRKIEIVKEGERKRSTKISHGETVRVKNSVF